MSFDLARLRALALRHGRVVRVVVAEVAGSAPREAGAAMLVWQGGQDGTIGGGALEWQAAARAREMLAGARDDRLDRVPLGPALQQCCGGAVTLAHEVWDGARLAGISGDVVARPLPGGPREMPMQIRRILQRARDRGEVPGTRIVQGWLVEPVAQPRRELWVWGAGHVGRAIVGIVAHVPQVRIVWVDTDAARFPDLPEGVARRVSPDPAALVGEAPQEAEHLVLTYSHEIDLALCHALLTHGFARAGLIGSATKWARFRSRLRALGHSDAAIARIRCPIGDPALGKHPQAIAIGVAAEMLNQRVTAAAKDARS